jgi:O-acetyl-ADP-ribose deacetylase (regulator of RNase III)
MQIVIVDRNKEAAEVFEWRFRDLPDVDCVHGSFESLDRFDCIATAGNSFGQMDAGIDLAIVKFFGRHVMEEIQRRIVKDFLGEQPVGTSIIVGTGHPKHGFVAHTPTMRIPMNISGTDNVYLATWGTLVATHQHNASASKKMHILAIPGFGTGTGGVDLLEASLQMRIACEHFINPPEHLNPSVAQYRHERIHYGGRYGFENPRQEDT